MNTHSLCETELLDRAPVDLEAFGELVERYREMILRLCINRVKDRDYAEDLAQETFIRAYQKLDQLQDPAHFTAWLRKIAMNLCREFFRQSVRREWAWETLPEEKLIFPEPDSIILGLRTLPEVTRRCVELFYEEGRSYQEIAKILGISPASVKARLQRAKASLREEMVEMAPQEKSAFTRRVIKHLEQLGSDEAEERAEAARRIHQALAEDQISELVEQLTNPYPEDRSLSVRKTRRFRSPRVRDALVYMVLHDEWEENQIKAANALITQGDPSVIPHLKQALDQNKRDRDVAGAIRSAIRQLEKKQPVQNSETENIKLREELGSATQDRKARVEILKRLEIALEDPDSTVRNLALKSIQELKDKRAVSAVLKLVDDPVPGIRQAAIITLGKLESARAVPMLLEQLKESEDQSILQAVIRALGDIGDPSAMPGLLTIFEKMHAFQLVILAAETGVLDKVVTPETLPEIKNEIQQFNAKHPEQNLDWLYRSLVGKVGDARNLDEILEALRLYPPTAEMIQALGRIPDPKAAEMLKSILFGLNISYRWREMAANALKHQGDSGIKILQEAIRHENPAVRKSVFSAALWAGDGYDEQVSKPILEALSGSNWILDAASKEKHPGNLLYAKVLLRKHPSPSDKP